MISDHLDQGNSKSRERERHPLDATWCRVARAKIYTMAMIIRFTQPHILASFTVQQRALPFIRVQARQYFWAAPSRKGRVPVSSRLGCRGERFRRGFCDGSKAQTSAEKESETLSLLDRIPWGLIFSLSFIGAVGGRLRWCLQSNEERM